MSIDRFEQIVKNEYGRQVIHFLSSLSDLRTKFDEELNSFTIHPLTFPALNLKTEVRAISGISHVLRYLCHNLCTLVIKT